VENLKFYHHLHLNSRIVRPVQPSNVGADGFQEVKRKKKVNQKPKMEYRPVHKAAASLGGASSSNAPFVSRNPYELLNENGEVNALKAEKRDTREDRKKHGYSVAQHYHQTTDAADNFDDDIDEHIEIHEETSARFHGLDD
jgi:CO/xanthine dehydrogenase Mo-binding subunit